MYAKAMNGFYAPFYNRKAFILVYWDSALPGFEPILNLTPTYATTSVWDPSVMYS